MSTEKATKPLNIFVFSVDGVGHLHACVGMAQTLVERGHKVSFLLNVANAGKFTKYGFEEIHLEIPSVNKNAKPEIGEDGKEKKQDLVKDLAKMVLESDLLNSKTPLEKLRTQPAKTEFAENMINGIGAVNPKLQQVIESGKPDLFILDHFTIPPALIQTRVPWISLFSGNPLMLYCSDKLPPFGAGYATDSDPETWIEYKKLHKEKFVDINRGYEEKMYKKFNVEPPKFRSENDFFRFSQLLTVYGYPEELDYHDIVPRPSNMAQVDAFCLESPEKFVLPETFDYKPGQHKLVYLSLGSMGAVDVKLIKRILSVLAKTPHRYIVSKGPLADEYDLPPNCWGEGFLPQTKILPMVDLVITHGGNNTVTETFTFGKPMLVLPLFADQYDNGQRLMEKGYGARLDTYLFEEQELIDTVNRMLNDKVLIEKCATAGKRVRSSNSKQRVAKRIEQLVADIQAKKIQY